MHWGNKMPTLFWVVLIGLVGGIAVGVQGPLSSLISQRLGMLESAFIVHQGGAVAALVLLLLLQRGGQLGEWRSLPWYILGAGALGVIVLGSLSYMIPRIGVAGAVIILVTGQLAVGALLDHFGWLGASLRPLSWERALGLAVMMAGVWLTVKQ